MSGRQYMRVGVQSHPHRGVPEALRDHLRVLLGGEQQRRAGVPTGIEREPLPSSPIALRIFAKLLCARLWWGIGDPSSFAKTRPGSRYKPPSFMRVSSCSFR